MSFDSLGLRAELLRAVHEQDYTTPTPVQAQAIPAILAGRDLMAAAQTGTGKTAGFTLPMLQRLLDSGPEDHAARRPVRALILVPTRELAAQVAESVRIYGAYVPLRGTQIFGGVGMQPQVDALRRGVDIVIATPGRLLDHVQRRSIDLSKVEILVLDEADRMLDMGFIAPIKRILSLLPAKRQNLLFSATFAEEIRELADRLMNSPEMIDVTPPNKPVEAIEQIVFHVDAAQKPDALAHLFLEKGWAQALVFTRTKHGADRLAKRLIKSGISADAIHGNKSQNARTRALATFKEGKVCALVATDIAARGLDIDGLPQVVNFELPHVPEDYVHRIGRTGRAGAVGHAISLVSRDEIRQLRAIERIIGRTLPADVVPGFEPMQGVPPATREGTPRGQERPQRQQRRDGGAAQPRQSDGAPPPRRGDGVARDGAPHRGAGGQRGPLPPRDGNRGPAPYRPDSALTQQHDMSDPDGPIDELDVIDEEDDARGNREPLPQDAQRPGSRDGRPAGRSGGRDRRPGGDRAPAAPPGVMSTRSGDTLGGWGVAHGPAPRRGGSPASGPRGATGGARPGRPSSGSNSGNGNNVGNSTGGAGSRPAGSRPGPRYDGGQPRSNANAADSGFSRRRYGYPEERGGNRDRSSEPRRYGGSDGGQRGSPPPAAVSYGDRPAANGNTTVPVITARRTGSRARRDPAAPVKDPVSED